MRSTTWRRCPGGRASHRPALHLDHDPFAGSEGGRVDLGDRSRGDGSAVEGGEHSRTTADRGLLRSSWRTCENGSGGTRSRRSRNSATSSSGNTPSPEERIWPSLIYVGPRVSNAGRSRRDSPVRDRSVPRSRMAHIPSAHPRCAPTRTALRPGGKRRRLTSLGASAATCDRSASMPVRQLM